jgi:hypothetical protein
MAFYIHIDTLDTVITQPVVDTINANIQPPQPSCDCTLLHILCALLSGVMFGMIIIVIFVLTGAL